MLRLQPYPTDSQSDSQDQQVTTLAPLEVSTEGNPNDLS
jgi:hypothetical protein